jgi:hypothetical protein
MRKFTPVDLPCHFCDSGVKKPCHTATGRRYPRLHVRRKQLAEALNDGAIRRLIGKA